MQEAENESQISQTELNKQNLPTLKQQVVFSAWRKIRALLNHDSIVSTQASIKIVLNFLIQVLLVRLRLRLCLIATHFLTIRCSSKMHQCCVFYLKQRSEMSLTNKVRFSILKAMGNFFTSQHTHEFVNESSAATQNFKRCLRAP